MALLAALVVFADLLFVFLVKIVAAPFTVEMNTYGPDANVDITARMSATLFQPVTVRQIELSHYCNLFLFIYPLLCRLMPCLAMFIARAVILLARYLSPSWVR